MYGRTVISLLMMMIIYYTVMQVVDARRAFGPKNSAPILFMNTIVETPPTSKGHGSG